MNEQNTAAVVAIEDQVERLRTALADLGSDDAVDLEIWRIEGTGRGGGGSLEHVEDFPFDFDSVNAGLKALRERLRVVHRGGFFQLYVRKEGGGYRLNQRIRIERQPSLAPPPVTQKEGTSELAAVLVRMDANAQAAAERFERLMLAMVEKKGGGIDDDLDRLTKIRAAFGSTETAKPVDPFEWIEKVTKLKEVLGGGDSDPWASLAKEWAPEIFGALRDMTGGDDDEEADDEPPADDEKLEAMRKALAGFTGQMQQAAKNKVSPNIAAGFALKAVKDKAALVRFCMNEKATGTLCKVAPELIEYAGWVERVRAEIAKLGAPKKPAELPPAKPKQEVRNANDAATDTGRPGGSAGNIAANAADRGPVETKTNSASAGGATGAGLPAKGLRRGSRKAASVRS